MNAGDKPVVTQRARDDEAARIINEAARLIKPQKGEAVFYIRVGGEHSQMTVKSDGIDPARALDLAMAELAAENEDLAKCPSHREQDTLSREGREADPFAAITEEVRELVEDEEAGFWRPCTGCHETDEGHPTGRFPFSRALNCELGHGCRECGGIGAVWDDTDYADMAEFMAAADRDHENIKRILIENGVKPYPAEMMTMEIRALEIPAALSPPASEGRDVGREAVAYLYESDDGSQELVLDCNGEYAQQLIKLGWTETPLAALSTAPASPEQADQADVLRERGKTA